MSEFSANGKFNSLELVLEVSFALKAMAITLCREPPGSFFEYQTVPNLVPNLFVFPKWPKPSLSKTPFVGGGK